MTGYSQINPFLPELLLVMVFLPAKESKLRQELSVQRRGEAKMLSLLHHCAGTQLSPEKTASLPPEAFPIFSTPPNGTITHSFRWG